MRMINSSETKLVDEKQYQAFTNFVNDNYKNFMRIKFAMKLIKQEIIFITLFDNDIVKLSDIFDVLPMA